ncbi:MAG: hypothetical protein EA403_13110 [Spirochaetaceae bacterium]|nr:MAG: hypothetical protein EA403_13110 [Spirochaetaceae bacterium]
MCTVINMLRVVAVMIVILSLSFCANPFGSSAGGRGSGIPTDPDSGDPSADQEGSPLLESLLEDLFGASHGSEPVSVEAAGFTGATAAFQFIDDPIHGPVIEAGGAEWAAALSPRFSERSLLADAGLVTEVSFDVRPVSDVSRPEHNRMGISLLYDNESDTRSEMTRALGFEFAPVTEAKDRGLENARVNAPSLSAQRRRALQTGSGNLIANGGSAPWLRITIRITEAEITVSGSYPGAGAIGAWANTVSFAGEDGLTNVGNFNRIELTHRGLGENRYQIRNLDIAAVPD